MMQTLPIAMDMQCEVCEGNEYSEHESGFYVCMVCGTMTQIRFGVGLDYADIHKSTIRIRKKTIDEDPDANIETMTNTMVNTCANSEFSDSVSTRFSRGRGNNNQVKSFNEIVVDHQRTFVNLFKSLCYFQNWKKENHQNGFEGSDCFLSFQEFEKLFDSDNYFQDLFTITKNKWKNLVIKEFSIQKGKHPIITKKTDRSRRNTEDKNERLSHTFHHHSSFITRAKIERNKRDSIREKLKNRKVINYNIENILDYKDKKLEKNQKMKLFIEEYDQVKSHLLTQKEAIENELKIPFNEFFTFKNLVKIAKNILHIKIESNSNFEEIVHQIFTQSGLNLISVFKEGVNYDETKSLFTPDNFLSTFYTIFNLSQMEILHLQPETDPYPMRNSQLAPILSGELLTFFKWFNLNNLYNHELKFLKYLNKDKVLKLLDNNTDSKRVEQTLNYLCNILNLPVQFKDICCKVFYLCKKKLEKHINNIYNLENFIFGIVLFVIKLFYGLNDLPYLHIIHSNKFQFNFENVLQTFQELSKKDKFYEIYKDLPGIVDLVKNLSKRNTHDHLNKIIWEPNEIRKAFEPKYTEKYFKFSENYLTSVEKNNYTDNNINSLEKKINIFQPPVQTNKHKTIKVTISEKVKLKREQRLKEDIKEKHLHSFISEEIEYYRDREAKNKKKIQIPLPCDTYLKFKKQAMKFEGVTPPLSELIVMYYFSHLFKIEYKILKKCLKTIENIIESVFK